MKQCILIINGSHVNILLQRTLNCSYASETENCKTFKATRRTIQQKTINERLGNHVLVEILYVVLFWALNKLCSQSVLYWCLSDALPSRLFNFLTMSFNVSCLSPPPLFCLFNTTASSLDSSFPLSKELWGKDVCHVCLFRPSIHLSIHLTVCLSVYLLFYISVPVLPSLQYFLRSWANFMLVHWLNGKPPSPRMRFRPRWDNFDTILNTSGVVLAVIGLLLNFIDTNSDFFLSV